MSPAGRPMLDRINVGPTPGPTAARQRRAIWDGGKYAINIHSYYVNRYCQNNNMAVWKRTRVTRVTLVKDGGRYIHFVLFTPKYR